MAGALALAFCCTPTQASANVGVLGLRPEASEDEEFASNMTLALRAAVDGTPGWSVSGRDVSLEQMLLVHGCESEWESCLSEIANSLGASKLVYGHVRRSVHQPYRYAVEVGVFELSEGRVLRRARDLIPQSQSTPGSLRASASRLVRHLSGWQSLGTLRLRVKNAGQATVLIDGDRVGRIEQGYLELELGVSPDPFFLEVRAADRRPFRRRVSVRAGDAVVLDVELP